MEINSNLDVHLKKYYQVIDQACQEYLASDNNNEGLIKLNRVRDDAWTQYQEAIAEKPKKQRRLQNMSLKPGRRRAWDIFVIVDLFKLREPDFHTNHFWFKKLTRIIVG